MGIYESGEQSLPPFDIDHAAADQYDDAPAHLDRDPYADAGIISDQVASYDTTDDMLDTVAESHQIPLEIVSFREISERDFKPFTVVSGMSGLRDIDTFEAELLADLSPMDRDDVEAVLLKESRIRSDRISNHMRVPGRNDSLRPGQNIATILPFDSERAVQHRKTLATTFGAGPMTEAIASEFTGFDVIYSGIMRSRSGEVNQINTETVYYKRLHPNGSALTRMQTYGFLVRTVGKTELIPNLDPEIAAQKEMTPDVAQALALNSIRHLYGSEDSELYQRLLHRR